ncbi:MAG: 1,2-phenylacetyl-CoA epoxidase subunit PaaE [Ferruginibacter sp.]
MAVHFHLLKVKAINKETADCVSVVFDVPEHLEKAYSYEQGQNITLKKTIDGEALRRSYSVCNAPHEKELKVAIKKVEGGKFSAFANDILQPGDELEVLPPTGKFNTALDASHKKNYLAFAAGSGITPVISLIKATLHTEPGSSFTLVFGNRSRASIIFFEELEAIKNKYLDRFSLINILSRERTESAINFGKIDEVKLTELEKLVNYSKVDEYFICGPEAMIFCVKDFLEQKGTDKKKIHFELFNSSGKIPSSNTPAADNGAQSTITVKADGRSFDIGLALNSNTTILDAALSQGADLPFACKGGMCCTCKAKLIEGEVSMDVSWGLEQEEIEKGFILTCQSHPKTEKVVVDFDIK